jgi:hypothetical protein
LQTKSLECDVCHTIYEQIAQHASSDEQTIAKYADAACEKLGFLASACKGQAGSALKMMSN